VHHDLAPDHLLHADGTLVALIDFGDACLSDPIAEIGGRLLGAYGEDFALRLLKGNRDALSAAVAYELWDRLGGAAARIMGTGTGGAARLLPGLVAGSALAGRSPAGVGRSGFGETGSGLFRCR
jgi:Phosphotransferase enzyme family